MNEQVNEQLAPDNQSEADIDGAVKDSFPASDPPATGGATRVAGNGGSMPNPGVADSDTGRADEQRVRELAYHLWEADGSPEGQAEEYWHRALKQLESENELGSKPTSADTEKTGQSQSQE
jgi:hypothetical protein